MKTTFHVDKDLLTELLQWTDAASPAEAVEQALAGWVRCQKLEALKALRGRFELTGEVADLRIMELEEYAADFPHERGLPLS